MVRGGWVGVRRAEEGLCPGVDSGPRGVDSAVAVDEDAAAAAAPLFFGAGMCVPNRTPPSLDPTTVLPPLPAPPVRRVTRGLLAVDLTLPNEVGEVGSLDRVGDRVTVTEGCCSLDLEGDGSADADADADADAEWLGESGTRMGEVSSGHSMVDAG